MAMLELKNVTVRFGGLTAVNQVGFSVEKGQVYSVIGPNGAGKTTVFNAVTGVYDPSEGEVLFDGQSLRRPFRPVVGLTFALIGLLTGILLALSSSNLDGLWRAVVLLNFTDPSEPFPAGKAAGDFWTYLNAGILSEKERNRLTELELKPRGGKFEIRSRGNKALLETLDDEEAATRRLEVLQSLVNLAGSPRTVTSGEGRWLVRIPSGALISAHAGEAAARKAAADLRDLPSAEIAEKPGAVLLIKNGRTLGTFAQRFEAEDYKSAHAWAAQAEAQSAAGKWLIWDDGHRQVLDVQDSAELARRRILDLAVASGKLRWRLVTRASAQSLGFAASPQLAAEEIRRLQELIAAAEAPRPPAKKDPKLREIATTAVTLDLSVVRSAQLRERFLVWLSLFAGLALGAGGSFVVWNRARRTTDYITRNGVARTFQNIRLFPDMLVVENVIMGMDARRSTPVWAIALNTPRAKADEEAARAKALELLDFVGIRDRAGKLARNLPYGDQRRLEIARALATEPRLLLLDEPAAGMNPAESHELMHLIRRIRDRGITVLLIEHHMKVVMGISDRIAVLQYGTKIAEGTPEEIRRDPKVIEAYLGKEEVS